jgi:hypothetical protein
MDSKRVLLSGLTLRLSVIGIPTYAINPLAGLMVKWTECSGEEWTVKRCKLLKQLLITTRTGNPINAPLARNRYGSYKGVVGSIIRWALKSDKNFYKALNAFMAYTHWTSCRVTTTQRKKFLDAVNAPVVEIPRALERALVGTTRVTVGHRTIREKPQPILVWQGSPNKRAPTLRGSVPQSELVLHELKLLDNEKVLDHVKRLSIIYDDVLAGLDWRIFVDSAHTDDIDQGPLTAGEVHFLQEPGYKLRSIASPYRLFQVASEPLKNILKGIVTELPWDCTHDQGRAFPVIQEALRQQKVVYSVDLSNATDYFPYQLQEIVLNTIFGKDSPYITLFREISRSEWKSELGVIRWNKGQPLGFNPSFFVFTLTHGLLLRTLLGKEWNNEFFVVGDDVVITDHSLYEKYIKTLSLLGCPYSPEKTLVSNKLSEFVGKVVTSDNIYPQLKWRDISDDNFLDLARLVGPRIRRLLTKRQRRVVDVFSHVSHHVHPYGLDWSYPGSNLEKMIRAGMLLTFEEKVLGSLTGLSIRINRRLHADYGPYTLDFINAVRKDDIIEVAKTFDEKVVSVFQKLGYTRIASEYFLEGLKDIPAALSGAEKHPELPLEEKQPSRVTLLHRLSRFLDRKPK